MGWWSINCSTTGGIDFSAASEGGLANVVPGEHVEPDVNGDEPADLMGEVVYAVRHATEKHRTTRPSLSNFQDLTLRENLSGPLKRLPPDEQQKLINVTRRVWRDIREAYQNAWGRDPRDSEVFAVVNFCGRPHFDNEP